MAHVESLLHVRLPAAQSGAFVLVALLAITLSACGSLDPVRIDASFTEAEAEAVTAAVDAWCVATDGGVCPGVIVARRDGDAISFRPGALPGSEAGREMGGQIMIDVEQLARAGDANALTVVAMHELGHALGLPHTPDGLMRKDVTNVPACVDNRALRIVCVEHGCGPNPSPCGGRLTP
jgi:hypothetical protein